MFDNFQNEIEIINKHKKNKTKHPNKEVTCKFKQVTVVHPLN